MEHRSGRIDRAPAVKATDKGRDWRAEVGARSDSASPVDLARAHERARSKHARANPASGVAAPASEFGFPERRSSQLGRQPRAREN